LLEVFDVLNSTHIFILHAKIEVRKSKRASSAGKIEKRKWKIVSDTERVSPPSIF